MARIFLACANREAAEKMTGLLASAGLPVFRAVANGGELRRLVHLYGDGILLICGRLPDDTPEVVADDLGERCPVMLLGHAAFLSACDGQKIFRLELPAPQGKIAGAVAMLQQLYEMRLPRRTGEDKEIVEKAKEHLMNEYGWNEPEAHRWLQRMAMGRRMKMTECAALILGEDQGGIE